MVLLGLVFDNQLGHSLMTFRIMSTSRPYLSRAVSKRCRSSDFSRAMS